MFTYLLLGLACVWLTSSYAGFRFSTRLARMFLCGCVTVYVLTLRACVLVCLRLACPWTLCMLACLLIFHETDVFVGLFYTVCTCGLMYRSA